jgi:hypothetical protein
VRAACPGGPVCFDGPLWFGGVPRAGCFVPFAAFVRCGFRVDDASCMF